MPKLTIEDLKKIREKAKKEIALREGKAKVKIIVHMGTCGIAAGARECLKAILEELEKTDRSDIVVTTAGCIGMCSTEPNITVEIEGQPPVVYQHMDRDKAVQVFRKHVLEGEVLTQFVLARSKEG